MFYAWVLISIVLRRSVSLTASIKCIAELAATFGRIIGCYVVIQFKSVGFEKPINVSLLRNHSMYGILDTRFI